MTRARTRLANHARLRFCPTSMESELKKLAHLQDVEQQVSALTEQMASYVRKIAAREAATAETNSELVKVKQSLVKETASRRSMESDTEDLRLKSTRYRAQLDSVQSDSQAKALEHQIAFCKQEIDRIEDLEFASLYETESQEARLRMLDETMVNQKLALDNERAAADIARARDAGELTELKQERTAVRASVETTLLAEYDRISGARKNAVATVEGQRCSACQMMVRPQRWNEIREGAVHFCESCGRFLFHDPAVDLRDAIELPPAAKKPSGPAKTGAHTQSAATGSDHPTRED
jgi:predicted  nucleic acid-binding Zn-ribbon protein